MPHTPSAKKRMRQYDKRRLYNRAYKKAIREGIKDFTAAAGATGGTPEQLAAAYKAAVKKLDKAAARKVIHPNKAARKKAQLAKLLSEQGKPAAAPAAK